MVVPLHVFNFSWSSIPFFLLNQIRYIIHINAISTLTFYRYINKYICCYYRCYAVSYCVYCIYNTTENVNIFLTCHALEVPRAESLLFYAILYLRYLKKKVMAMILDI